MANARGEALAKHLDDPNIQKFLDLLSAAEHTTEHGYNTSFGGSRFDSLTDHPRERRPFTQTDGKRNTSSAAGRYQFLESTWDDVAKRLGLDDFSPRNQDLGALELIRRNGAIEDIKKGDFATAIKKTGKTWASLPSSPYPQPRRSAEWVDQFLAANAMETAASSPTATVANQLAAADGVPPVAAVPAPSTDDLPVLRAAGAPQAPAVPNNLLAMQGTMPAAVPAWASRLPQSEMPEEVSAEDIEPWAELLLAEAAQRDADTARLGAVSSFFGETPAPEATLPRAFDRAIQQIVARL